MEGYARYPEYRESGVEWLGTIPNHWRVLRLKHIADANAEALSEETSPNFELEYLDIGGVAAGGAILETTKYCFRDAPSRARRCVRAGDTIVSTVRTYLKAIALLETPPSNLIVSTGFAVLRPRPTVLAGFLYHLVQSSPFVEMMVANSDGVGYPAINPSRLISLPVCLPPHTEQQAILSFLEDRIGHIDRLIEKKQQLIEALRTKRGEIARMTVMRGAKAGVPLKPSGIDWVGDVPAHWAVKRLKHFASIGNGSTPDRDNLEYWEGGSYPWLNSSVANESEVGEPPRYVTNEALRKCHLPKIVPPAVLIAITGQGKTRGKATVLRYEATINQHLAFVRPQPSLARCDYLALLLANAYTRLRNDSEAAGSTRGGITCEQIANFKVVLPPLQEQVRILDHVRKATSGLTRTESKLQGSVKLLQERRTALISAAVTGQINVRPI